MLLYPRLPTCDTFSLFVRHLGIAKPVGRRRLFWMSWEAVEMLSFQKLLGAFSEGELFLVFAAVRNDGRLRCKARNTDVLLANLT